MRALFRGLWVSFALAAMVGVMLSVGSTPASAQDADALTCSTAENADGTYSLSVSLNGGDVFPLFVRRSTGNGSQWIETIRQGELPGGLPDDLESGDGYFVRFRSGDTVTDISCTAGGGGDATCISSGNVLTFSGPNVDRFQVRALVALGGVTAWVATVEDSRTYTIEPGGLGVNYVIRFRSGGTTTDVPCTSDFVDPCVNSGDVLTFADQGVDRYQVRAIVGAGGATAWIATVDDGLTYTIEDRALNYVLRWTKDGQTFNEPCVFP